MLPLSLTEANLRAAFWRAIEGISADQICTTSRDDTAFSINLRKSDSRDRESRFEREMESKARHKGAKAEASLKQAAIPDKKRRQAQLTAQLGHPRGATPRTSILIHPEQYLAAPVGALFLGR